MAKENGLGMSFTVDDSAGTPRDISNDTTSLEFGTPRAVQDSTGLDRFANERILLLADMSVTATIIFNDAANLGHAVFRTVPSTSVARTTAIAHSGQTLSAEMYFTDYPLSRAQSGELTAQVPGALANGAVPTWA